jgi:NADH-quinone oxidoreductase subunit A
MSLAAYCLLFTAVGVGFLFVNLVVGKLIRPNRPGVEKGTIYECGEPTIGSAWIQFDLRFYVVALLFVIFDVEVAFFFPWAEVFGRANDVAALPPPQTAAEYKDYCTKVLAASTAASGGVQQRQAFRRLAEMSPEDLAQFDQRDDLSQARTRVDLDVKNHSIESAATNLAWAAFGEILVFFGVLLVGFVYLWRRGDLAWVRSTAAERPESSAAAPTAVGAKPPTGQVLTGAGAH